MKKLLAGLCAGVLALSLMGCGDDHDKKDVKKPAVDEKETPKETPKESSDKK